MTLTLHTGGRDEPTIWSTLRPDARRERALVAVATRDVEDLCDLTVTCLVLRGRAGARLSPHTRLSYRQGIRALLLAWPAEDLLRPGRDAAHEWLRHMESAGLSASTLRTRRAAARALYAAFRWVGIAEIDPFADVHPAKDPTAPWDKRAPFTQGEIEALLAVADPADRVLILLGAHGGLRLSECLNARWEHVALASATLTIPHGKGGKRRAVALSRSVVEALRAVGGNEGYVMPYRGQTRARTRLKTLCAQAGVAYKSPHCLRHHCGTRLMRESGDLERVARHLGHASLETSRIYTKWSDEGLRESVGDW
jgi:integrase